MNEAVETLLSIGRQSNEVSVSSKSCHLVTDNLGTPPQSEDEFESNSNEVSCLSFGRNDERDVANNSRSELARVCTF